MSSSATVRRVIRFSLTGLLVTGVHVAVASLWINRVHPLPAVANGVAFVTATVVGLLINTYWTFSGQLDRLTAVRYFAVAILGLLTSMALPHGVYLAGLSYWYGIGLVVVIMPVLNFLLHHHWTYRH